MLERFPLTHKFAAHPREASAVRDLRAQLCDFRGPPKPALIDALLRAAARGRDAAALVALVHERLVELSRPELMHLASVLREHDKAAAEQLQAMAAQCQRLQPTAGRPGDRVVALWKAGGDVSQKPAASQPLWLKKWQAPEDALVAQARKARPLGELVYPGCRLPPQGERLESAAEHSPAPTMHIYRALLVFPNLVAQMPLAAFQGRTQHTGAALVGASLQHGNAAWRTRLLDLLGAFADPDLACALLPHGDMLRPLGGQDVRWIDWLVVLQPTWQAAQEVARAALRDCVAALGMEAAVAWAACVAAASCGTGGASIAVLLGELPAASRHAVIAALLQAPALRAQLHAACVFEATWQAQHGLACLGAAMALPESASEVYRNFRVARKGGSELQPEVALWLTCLSCADATTPKAQLLRLLDMGAAHLEMLEKEYPALRQRLVERLGDIACESPLVNAFTDTSTRAIVAAGPGRPQGHSRLQQACIKHLRAALASSAPARSTQRMFAGLSQGQLAGLRQAICEDSETLLWPLYTASLNSRHVLRTGLPLIDDAIASINDARAVFEALSAAALPATAAAHATHLALVMQKNARNLWSSSVQRLEDDALLLAMAGLGMHRLATHGLAETLQPGHGAWTVPERLQRSAEIAPQIWRIVQSEDGSQGKLTDVLAHDIGRVVRLFVEAPSLLRHAIDRLGQQPSRLFADEVIQDEDDDEMPNLESVGDFLEEALRRTAALTDTLPNISALLAGQRLTDVGAQLPEGIAWAVLPEAEVRRTAQICQWLASLNLTIATPRLSALRRRDTVDHLRCRRPVYDALAFATPAHAPLALHQAADVCEMAPALCRDLGHVHSFGLMPLPRKPTEALSFSDAALQAPQNLHNLRELHALMVERDQIDYPARWSKCVQALLADVVGEIAQWGRGIAVSEQTLQQTVVASLSHYLSGFTALPMASCQVFCERALPWGSLMVHLPERPQDPGVGRALQLVADFAVLSRLT